MASNATRIMVRSSNREWTSPKTKPDHSSSRIATVKPVAKDMALQNGKGQNGFSYETEEDKAAENPPKKESKVIEKDALVVELEKCLTELENDQDNHVALTDDYMKIEKEKDDLLTELESTFQELEEYMTHVKELEAEKKEIVEERDELAAQVQNLTYCLSGRQVIQDQQSGWKDKKRILEEEITELKGKNENLQEEVDALYEERQSLINSLLNLNSDQVNEVIKTRSRSSSTVSTDSSGSFLLRGENEELSKCLRDAEEAEEKALGELQESKVHVIALQQTVTEQEQEITQLTSANKALTNELNDHMLANKELSKNVDALQNDILSLKASASEETENVAGQLRSTQQELASKQTLLDEHLSEKLHAEKKIKDLECTAKAYESEINDAKTKMTTKCQELDKHTAQSSLEKQRLEASVNQLKSEKSNLENKTQETEAVGLKAKEYSQKIEKLTKEISSLKVSAAVTEDKMRTLVNDASVSETLVGELHNETRRHANDIKELRKKEESLTHDVAEKSRQVETLLGNMDALRGDADEAAANLALTKCESSQLAEQLLSAKNHNEKLSNDNDQLNKRILENHKQKIESLESLLESERKKVNGFDERIEALSLQIDGDKRSMSVLQEENEQLEGSLSSVRLENTKLREQAKRQRMTSNSVQELVQHKLREEKQSLGQRCEALQSALDKANAENKSLLEQLDAVNETSAATIKALKTKRYEIQLEFDDLSKRYDKSDEQIDKMQKEIDTYESFNQAHVDRKLEASGQGSSLLERVQGSEERLKQAKARITQLEASNEEYPKKLEEAETLINDLQRALSQANDLAMEKSLEISRSKRNLEKKMEKILKENIDLKRKLISEGVPYATGSSTPGASPFHSRGLSEVAQSPLYEPKNDPKLGFSSAVDLRRIDSPAIVKKTELMTFAQLATPTRDTRMIRSRSESHESNSPQETPSERRVSAGVIKNELENNNHTRGVSKSGLDSPPVKPPPPVFYEARLKKTGSKRDTPHPEKMYYHRTQLSLDGSMDEIAARKLLSGSTDTALQGGRLEHWV